MNNNYFNFNPNSSFIRNVPNIGFNPMSGMRNTSGLVGLPRISSLFSGARAASGIGTTSKLTFSSILTGAGKTLGVINQAIPVFYQVKPIWNNAKTMFRVVKEMKVNDNNYRVTTNNIKVVNKSNEKEISTSNISEIKKEDNSPTFFI